MTENHQTDVLALDQIKQFNRPGTDYFGIRVAPVVLPVTGKVLAEGYSVNPFVNAACLPAWSPS